MLSCRSMPRGRGRPPDRSLRAAAEKKRATSPTKRGCAGDPPTRAPTFPESGDNFAQQLPYLTTITCRISVLNASLLAMRKQVALLCGRFTHRLVCFDGLVM